MNKAFIFLFFSITMLRAQVNLVYNGDFELFDTCPITGSQPGNYQIEHCLGWKSPNYATSDYYNSCNGNPSSVNTPINFIGFQIPRSGEGYCGLIPFQPKVATYWFEYIQGKTTSPLELGKTYKVSFWVSYADGYVQLAIRSMGLHLSNTAISSLDWYPFNAMSPQIVNSSDYLTDTLDWTEISGSYTALGGEEYLTIGLFCDTGFIDSIRTIINYPLDFVSYYYIDDVSIIEIEDSLIIPNVFTPSNDGLNDFWKVANALGYSCIIYDRWGVMVYESTDVISWNGKMNNVGSTSSQGVYYYVIESKTKKYKGFIHLF